MFERWRNRVQLIRARRKPVGAFTLPHESELVDGINEIDLTPGENPSLSTRFGYCPRCRMVYPPEWTHGCEGNRSWSEGQPIDRDGM